jgi:hypothetical protein
MSASHVRRPLLALPGTVLLLAGLLLAGPAQAFRCGTRLVSQGDPAAKVRRFCGEPDDIQQRVVYRSGPTRPPTIVGQVPPSPDREELAAYDRSLVEVVVQEWTYNFGPRRLMQRVRFENGLVVAIETIGYGYVE